MTATMNVGEYGKYMYVNANYNMSANTGLALTITRPDKSVFTRTNPDVTISASPYSSLTMGTFAANSYLIYKFQQGDLTVEGEYLVRAIYDDSGQHLVAGGTSFTVTP
jgi:hypothetical protein